MFHGVSKILFNLTIVILIWLHDLINLQDFTHLCDLTDLLKTRKWRLTSKKAAHCQFVTENVCKKSLSNQKCIITEYLGRSFKKTTFADSELRPWLRQTFPKTIPNIPQYIFNSSCKICTANSQNIIEYLWMWHTRRFKDYVLITILTAIFAISFDFFKGKHYLMFDFNLQSDL